MKIFLLGVLGILAVLIGAYLYRVLQGPTIFDRVLGLNGISTKAIILLVLIGAYFERVDMFVDISTGYALSSGRRQVLGTERTSLAWTCCPSSLSWPACFS